jgi:excisionase family DNA binding protein
MKECFVAGIEGILVHHAARRLNRSERTVRRFIQLGKLPARRFGRRSWVIAIADIDSFLVRRRSSW